MSGHSKWKTIKHKKGAADAKRGQLFTKLAREITIAVRKGSGVDPGMNFHLRLAIDKAKENNMPSENIDRAVKRGSGESGDNEQLEEVLYEGYSPGGAAIMLQAVTSNRNRTASEVRATFSKSGASLGALGCVSWNFESKGVITLEAKPHQAEEIALIAIDAGADDVKIDSDLVEIHTEPHKLVKVQRQLEEQSMSIATAEISMIAKSQIELDSKSAQQTLKLLDALEDLDDAQKVYTNANFPDEVLKKYESLE